MQYHPNYLNEIDLTPDANYAAFVSFLRDTARHPDYPHVRKQIDLLEQWLASHSAFGVQFPDRLKELQHLRVLLLWVCLPALTYNEPILELFHDHINDLFALPEELDVEYAVFGPQYVLGEGLRTALTNIPLWDDRDKFKEQLIGQLMTNQEVYTTAPFFDQFKQVPATIALWLKHYTEFTRNKEYVPKLLDRFLREDDNAKAVTPAERGKLRLLFNTYERLHTSSKKIGGVEEEVAFTLDDGQTGNMQYGIMELDSKERKEEFHSFMKNYKDILLESGLYDPVEIMEMVQTHPPVSTVSSRLNPNHDVETLNVDATKGPDHFTEEDEDEINRHAQEVSVLAAGQQPNYQATANDIKAEMALSFATPQDEKKFVDLVVSVLRGLRDTMELKTYLLDLSFPSAECDAVIAAVEGHLDTVPAARKAKQAARKDKMEQKLAAKPTLQQVQKTLQPDEPTSTYSTQPAATSQVEPPQPASTTAPRKAFLPKLRRSRAVRRPLVDDVRLQPSMVMGPIDELRAMDTIEFRRLSPDPVSAARRLKDQIELLAEESITKQAEGIEAFKQSPLNRLYLELGNASIASGKSVTAVIDERTAAGQPTLSDSEFNAISDLNKQLRF
jgi:hypothetical protein